MDDSCILDDPFHNMKVAELKKELKSRGLPVAGTKQELLERLQIVHAQESSSNLNVDEDEIFNDDDVEQLSDIDIDTKVLKKLASPTSTEKKISLNRMNPVIAPTPAAVGILETKTSQEVLKEDNVAKRNVSTVRSMTAQERLAMRAQRFNVSSTATKLEVIDNTSLTTASKYKVIETPMQLPDIDVLKRRAERFGENVSSVMKQLPDIDILKRRGERFGENVSSVMKQLEAEEKVSKRKLRFGTSNAVSAISSMNEIERKKLRAERFNL